MSLRNRAFVPSELGSDFEQRNWCQGVLRRSPSIVTAFVIASTISGDGNWQSQARLLFSAPTPSHHMDYTKKNLWQDTESMIRMSIHLDMSEPSIIQANPLQGHMYIFDQARGQLPSPVQASSRAHRAHSLPHRYESVSSSRCSESEYLS